MIRRSLAVGVGFSLLAPIALSGTASAAPAPDADVVDARAWLLTQQQDDGGFEVAGFPGFETPDAILALAAASQTGVAWDEAAALAAVAGAQVDGNDPLDAIEALVDGEADPSAVAAGARAAKLISLVIAPLGLDAHDFDPSGDDEEPVDLVARMDVHRQEDGSYEMGAQFVGELYAALALDALGEEVPAALVAQIEAGQRADGSWDYTGSPTEGPGGENDTTSIALLALRAGGLGTSDADVRQGIAFLAGGHQASGAWQAFGSDDPNATALAVLALSAHHIDLDVPTWRASYGNPASGGYVKPQTWLRAQQVSEGRIASPSDAFGQNTFPTSQSIQALARQWYLADDHALLVEAIAVALGSPDGTVVPAAGPVAADALGANPSSKAARLAAADAMLASDLGRRAAAADLFQQAFSRTIDPSGRAYWSTKLLTISRPEMLARLTGSSEFYRKAGGTIPSFVDAVYQRVLGRAADPSGRAYWIGRLERGDSVERVARSLVASNEYRRRQVEAVFLELLDRAPTTGERDYWTAKIATTRIEVLMRTLAGSAELYDGLGA